MLASGKRQLPQIALTDRRAYFDQLLQHPDTAHGPLLRLQAACNVPKAC